jgi:hypothetical protein
MDQFADLAVKEGVVAIGLMSERDPSVFGSAFARLWPVEQERPFGELLRAIDEAAGEPECIDPMEFG